MPTCIHKRLSRTLEDFDQDACVHIPNVDVVSWILRCATNNILCTTTKSNAAPGSSTHKILKLVSGRETCRHLTSIIIRHA